MGSQGSKRRSSVSPGRRKPGEQVYRSSDRAIRNWTIGILLSIVLIAAVGIALIAIGWEVSPVSDASETPLVVAGWLVFIGAFVFPVLLAAVMGGEALHRGGSVVGIILVAGGVAVVYARVNELRDIEVWGWIVTAVGVIGFFVLGFIRRVPMGIGRPGQHNISDGRLPGESAPGKLPRARRKN